MEIRSCKKCGQDKPITSFPRRYGKSIHLREHTCGMCKKQANLRLHPEKKSLEGVRRRARQRGVSVEEYEYRCAHRKPLVLRRRVRAFRCPVLIRNPEYDTRAAADKAAASRDYYQRFTEKAREKVRRWKRSNPAAVSAQRYRRRVRLDMARCDLTEFQWAAIKAAYGGRCAYCRKRRPLTQDHVIPVSLGGEHTANNIVPACQSCNSSKGARLPAVTYQPHLIV